MMIEPVRFEGTADMCHFLLQQRTEYGVFSTQGLNVKAIMQAYREDMLKVFQSVRPVLPAEGTPVVRILDIGGGLGGMAVMMAKHFGPMSHVTLLEKEGDEGSKIGWHDSAEEFGAYNSGALTTAFLEANGVDNYGLYDAHEGFPPANAGPFEVVISLLSLGFHYPVETYLDQIYDSLNTGGIFLCDIRTGTKGELACVRKFDNCFTLGEGAKHTLYGFRKL